MHGHAGYTVTLLILFRLLWGVMGPRHARFSDFVATPSTMLIYLKQLFSGTAKRHIGHNPAGAAMILALLISLSITALSGMCLFAMEGSGPLAYTFVSSWPGGVLEETHEFFSNFTLILIIVHVIGVLLTSLRHKENLTKAMITGVKQLHLALVPVAVLLLLHSSARASETTQTMLEEFQVSAARPFSSAAGNAAWMRESNGRSCTSCHTDSVHAQGRHVRTGKLIEPMAPSVNSDRLTDRKKIDKWLLRNCKWTFGRECTIQEKGDILLWLSEQ